MARLVRLTKLNERNDGEAPVTSAQFQLERCDEDFLRKNKSRDVSCAGDAILICESALAGRTTL